MIPGGAVMVGRLVLHWNGELVIGYFAVNLISRSGGAPPGRAFFWMYTAASSSTESHR